MGDLVGKTIRGYEVLEGIGSGGFGAVYRAKQPSVNREVAVKIILPERAKSEYFVKRFDAEAQLVAKLEHPYIVPLYDYWRDEEGAFLIMRWLHGGSLREHLANKPVLADDLMRFVQQIGDALSFAHEHGVVHRDLKPDNILLDEKGNFYLTDFGIAKDLKGEIELSTLGGVTGTPAYLSPEQAMGNQVTAQSDIYSFGVVLYELCTGEHPFPKANPTQQILHHISDPFPLIREKRPEIPSRADDVIAAATEKLPEERYQDILEFVDDFNNVMIDGGEEISTEGQKKKASIKARQPTTPPKDTSDMEIEGREYIGREKRNNLPAQTTPFIGRQKELQEIGAALDQDGCRLLTLLGPGGVGKTRLALAYAEKQLENYRHGVYFVQLAALNEAEHIASTIAEAVGFRFAEGDPKQGLLNYIQEKEMLLVMDNFEHILEGTELIIDMVDKAPGLEIIATSRARLKLSAESVLDIDGMQLPQDQDSSWEESEAVEMFVAFVRRMQPKFEMNEDNKQAIARICRLVEGMPLGIELAAAWARSLTPEEIADELEEDINILQSEMADTPKRQQSMRAAFDYSQKLLNSEEQDVFIRLTAFRSGFTRDAAKVVGGTSIRSLQSLVDTSLLKRDPDSGRYSIHEFLRQYGFERLEQTPDAFSEVHRQHGYYFMKYLNKCDVGILVGNQQDQKSKLDTEFGNIRAAWEWAIDTNNLEMIENGMASLYLCCQALHRYIEGKELFTQSQAKLEQNNADPEALLGAMVYNSWFGIRLGKLEEAKALLERSNELARKNKLWKNKFIFTDPRVGKSMLASMRGDHEEAVLMAVAAVNQSNQSGNPFEAVLAHYAVVGALYGKGEYERAEEFAAKGFEIGKGIGEGNLTSYLLNERGKVARAQGNFEQAGGYFQESYHMRYESRDAEGMAAALNLMGENDLVQGNHSEAWKHYRQSYALYKDMGDIGGLSTARFGLASTAWRLEDPDKAKFHYHAALEKAVEIQFVALIISIIIGAAAMIESQMPQRAVQLMKFVNAYPGSNQDARDQSEAALKRLEEALTEEEIKIELSTGEQLSIEEVVEQLLNRDLK